MKRQTPITLDNVTKRFGDVDAVNDVTLRIENSEIVGFVGPNGAGKTTTMSMLMGFIRPTSGSVRVFGTDIQPESAHRTHRKIGYIAGDMALPAKLTGKQYLDFMAGRAGRDEATYRHLTDELSPVIHKPLKTLSRGNKQKIALLAALQHKPQLLILDEPTSGLDPLMQEVFLRAIRRSSSHGTTILMSSHILSEVSSVCNRILFMKNGRLTLDKPIDGLVGQTGKLVTVTTNEPARLVSYLPKGAQIVSRSGKSLTISVNETELKPFLRWLLTKEFSDISIAERELDDVFHDMYRGGSV
jgi:ABC-2 type transport system ATP-binding protein